MKSKRLFIIICLICLISLTANCFINPCYVKGATIGEQSQTYYFKKVTNTDTLLQDVYLSQNSDDAFIPQSSDVDLLQIESDTVPIPPPGYSLTNVEEICAMGLEPPSESLDYAQKQGNVLESNEETLGYGYGSFILRIPLFPCPYPVYKKTICGSYTFSMPWPWWISLRCQTKINGTVVDNFSWYHAFGRLIIHTHTTIHSLYQRWTFNQYGWHSWWFNNIIRESDITIRW